MTLVPSDADVEAGFTEVLTAVAVFHGEREPWAKVPWAHAADAGFQLPGEVWNWLRRLDGWERKFEDVLYLVPEADYVPLNELRPGDRRNLARTTSPPPRNR